MKPHTLIVIAPDVYHGIHVRSSDAYERFTVHFTSEIIAPARQSVLMGSLPTARTLRDPPET